MKKKVIIKTNIVPLIAGLVLAVVYLARIAMSIYWDISLGIKQWSVLLMIVYVCAFSTRTITCTKEEICVCYIGILKRRIPVDRITSIEFVMYQRLPYIIFCIDGHPTYENSEKPFQFFTFSTKVITILIPENKCQEYSREVSELYSNVTLVNWDDSV